MLYSILSGTYTVRATWYRLIERVSGRLYECRLTTLIDTYIQVDPPTQAPAACVVGATNANTTLLINGDDTVGQH